MTKYHIIPDLNLIICSYQGAISMNDFIELTKIFIKDPDYNPEFDVFIDLMYCSGVAFRIDLMDYIGFFKNSVKLKKKVKVGILLNSINQEFLVKVYKNFGSLLNLDIEYFRNYKSYYGWTNFDDNQLAQIEQVLASFSQDNPID